MKSQISTPETVDQLIELLQNLKTLLEKSLVTEYVGVRDLSPKGVNCPIAMKAALKMLEDNSLKDMVEICQTIGAILETFDWLSEDYVNGRIR